MKKIIISLLMAAVTAAALTGCKEAGDIEDSSYVLAMGIEKTENGYLIDYSCADFPRLRTIRERKCRPSLWFTQAGLLMRQIKVLSKLSRKN